MGLTASSSGLGALEETLLPERRGEQDRVIALAGNPNVGKSTVFNALTGMHQHTGNWPGKTVASARGTCVYKDRTYHMIDLPGTYSLHAHSAEEAVARDFLRSGGADAVVVVCDATCLERNLNLVLQTIALTEGVVVCVNLMDEAERKGIHVDLEELSRQLGVPAVGTAAGKGEGLEALMEAAAQEADHLKKPLNQTREEAPVEETIRRAEKIAGACVQLYHPEPDGQDRRLDRILTGKATGIPLMLLLLLGIFWLTIEGANVPSELLSNGLFWVQDRLTDLFRAANAPAWLHGVLILGVYRTVAWVVSVMLPPMAIFFPLFTLLEDFGYLPRVAFVLDRAFQKACACGKQALTMCMGFGCNAAGVVGCRIIDSPRERMIAILTNCFVPCNGRFPILISILTMFFVGAGALSSLRSALLLTAVIVLGVAMTLIVSRLLSATILKGMPSSFTLELPPYRRPRIGQVIVRSVLDRTLFVLGRAVAVAAPAGLVIWLCANVTVGDANLLAHCTRFLDPLGRLLGMDGVILMAFLLGFPANEIVMPIVVMAYLAGGSLMDLGDLTSLHTLLVENGWTSLTAICTMLFSLMHWPCSTTCLTMKKETGSWKWTFVGIAVPTLCGMLICLVVATCARGLGLG